MSAPQARTASGSNPFTVAWVPTGINAGVATIPCGVTISPVRAAPSVAMMRNEKTSAMINGLAAHQETGIAIGIEAVVGLDRVRVSAFHQLEAGECRDQHE